MTIAPVEYDVFISHATADDVMADRIYDALTATGLKVWIDHQYLKPGEDWEDEIQKILTTCKAGLILLSKTALERVQCKGERQYLFNKYQRSEVKVFTALLEALTPDEIPYAVNAIQYVNLSADFDGQLAVLVSAMQNKLTAAPLPKLESKELPPEAPKSTFASARLIADSDDLIEAPRKLIGRDDALVALENFLNEGKRVVVQAHGGAGKTALAATFAENWLKQHPKIPMLWLRADSADTEALLDAIGQALNQAQAVTIAHDDAKINLVRQLLRAAQIGLLVIDDVWNAPALTKFVEAVPKNTALLVTSRLRCDTLDDLYTLPDLQSAAALELLAYHGGAKLINDPDAPALIAALGELAFAVEIAGKTLKRTGETAGDLLTQIKAAPHDLKLLGAKPGRENVTALIDTSLNSLDAEAKAVFLAFGAFFAPQVTAELMMLYFVGEPNIPAELVERVRRENPQFAEMPDDRLRELIRRSILAQTDPTPAAQILMRLHESGLASYLPKTDTTVPAFRQHDLSHAYAAAQTDDDQRRRALTACLTYAKRYNTPGWNSYRPLLPTLDTLLEAAAWAFTHRQDSTGDSIADVLVFQNQLLSNQGLFPQALRLLAAGAEAARRRGDQKWQGIHLGNLGIAYRNLGDYQRAIDYYQQALTISQVIGDKLSEGSDLGNLGNAYYDLGDYLRAIDQYQQALSIARDIGDKRNEGNWLGNLGNVYDSLQDYQRAIDHHQQALTISQAITDKRAEGQDLCNLGNAYNGMGDSKQAIDYYQQALIIYQKIGDRSGEASALNNLGAVYEAQADYLRALNYYTQAQQIFVAIGQMHRVEHVDRNIAIVQAKMAGGGQAE